MTSSQKYVLCLCVLLLSSEVFVEGGLLKNRRQSEIAMLLAGGLLTLLFTEGVGQKLLKLGNGGSSDSSGSAGGNSNANFMGGIGHHQQFPGMGHQLPGLGHQLPGFGHQLPGLGHRLSGLVHRLSGLGHQHPGLGQQLPGLGHQYPGLRQQLSGLGQQLSGLGYQSHGLGHQLPGLGHQLYGLGKQLPGLEHMHQLPGFNSIHSFGPTHGYPGLMHGLGLPSGHDGSFASFGHGLGLNEQKVIHGSNGIRPSHSFTTSPVLGTDDLSHIFKGLGHGNPIGDYSQEGFVPSGINGGLESGVRDFSELPGGNFELSSPSLQDEGPVLEELGQSDTMLLSHLASL